jgi:hypothetical protein
MADFTIAELAYIDLFNRLKHNIPLRDASVFQQPITTREELLDTILAKPPTRGGYELASFYTFVPQGGKIAQGKQAPQYNVYGDTFEFWKLKTLKQFSDLLCSAIVDYMPRLRLPDPTTLLSSSSGFLDEFKRHYDTSIQLLLDGPPHANQHTINKELAAQWVAAQKTPERKRLAQLLVDKTIYISHKHLLEKIQDCVQHASMKLIEGPVTFIVGTKDKSNYYISLLFYHFWKNAGLRVDAVKTHMDGLVVGNLLDIDEMAYSGSQTTGTLAKVFANLVYDIQQELNALNASFVEYNTNLPVKYRGKNIKEYGMRRMPWNVKEGQGVKGLHSYRQPVKDKYIGSYAKTKIFLPVMLIESILNTHSINYIVIRVFCSENGQKALLEMPVPAFNTNPIRVKPPFYLIVGEVIPSPQTVFGEEDALKLGFMFGVNKGYPAAPVYFNHKVADLPSTYLNPYAYGVIPDRLLYADPNQEGQFLSSLTPEERAIYNSLQTPESATNTTEFLPFIEYCQKDSRPMPSKRLNLFKYTAPGEEETLGFRSGSKNLPQVFRCPYAWYKNINYDTGTYTPPPELRRSGGTRRVKRRSTKRRMTHRK